MAASPPPPPSALSDLWGDLMPLLPGLFWDGISVTSVIYQLGLVLCSQAQVEPNNLCQLLRREEGVL